MKSAGWLLSKDSWYTGSVLVSSDRTTPRKLGGLHQKTLDFLDFFIIYIGSNCCCTHLLANSKVLELLDASFQSYDGLLVQTVAVHIY